jgi:hypothetical protein
MNNLFKIFSFTFLIFNTSAWSCETLSLCMAKFYHVADESSGISTDESQLAKKIASFGEDAVVELLPILLNEKEKYRDLAGFALRSVETIDEKYLDALYEGLKKDRGWLPTTIAKIGTIKAKDYLIHDFIRKPESGGQMGFAFAILGEKVTKDLIHLYRCSNGCEQSLLFDLSDVFGNIDTISDDDVLVIMSLINDRNVQSDAKNMLIDLLLKPKKLSKNILNELASISKVDPFYSNIINQILIKYNHVEAKQLMVKLIEADTRGDHALNNLYYKLTQMEGKGTFALPALYKVALKIESRNRYRAIRTIGFVGNSDSITFLSNLLDEKIDWMVVYSAINSLSQLNAKTELSKLKSIAGSHWYKIVRDAAQAVIDRFDNDGEYQSILYLAKYSAQFSDFDNPEELDLKYGDIWIPELGVCDYKSFKKIEGNTTQKQYINEKNEESFIEFSYFGSILSDGYFSDDDRLYPHVVLKAGNDWLLGRDQGEFGGELLVKQDNNFDVLLNENIEDIYKMDFGYIATTGLAHMIFDSGYIYLISKTDSGNWNTDKWLKLPGAPRTSWFIEGNKLLINTTKASITITQTGDIETVECEK